MHTAAVFAATQRPTQIQPCVLCVCRHTLAYTQHTLTIKYNVRSSVGESAEYMIQYKTCAIIEKYTNSL